MDWNCLKAHKIRLTPSHHLRQTLQVECRLIAFPPHFGLLLVLLSQHRVFPIFLQQPGKTFTKKGIFMSSFLLSIWRASGIFPPLAQQKQKAEGTAGSDLSFPQRTQRPRPQLFQNYTRIEKMKPRNPTSTWKAFGFSYELGEIQVQSNAKAKIKQTPQSVATP